MNTTTFYYLMRNKDRCIFYVGQTKNIPQRLKNHIYEARRGNTPKDEFIKACNYDISIMPFETATYNYSDRPFYREKYWIQTIQRMGHPLLNRQDWINNYEFKNRTFYYDYGNIKLYQ